MICQIRIQDDLTPRHDSSGEGERRGVQDDKVDGIGSEMQGREARGLQSDSPKPRDVIDILVFVESDGSAPMYTWHDVDEWKCIRIEGAR